MTTTPVAKGFDYADPNIPVDVIYNNGGKFICRYATGFSDAKNLTAHEVARAKALGVDIVSIFETSATRALGGFLDGALDAAKGRTQHEALGLPKGRPMYFAVDFNPSNAEMASIADYFRGLRQGSQGAPVGVYGSYAVCVMLSDFMLADYVWQTYAWSYGKWATKTNIRQTGDGITLNSYQVDIDEAFGLDFGQWSHVRKGDTMNVALPEGTNVHAELGCAGATKFRLHNGYGESVEMFQLVWVGDTPGPTGASYLPGGFDAGTGDAHPLVWEADRPGPLAIPTGATQCSIRYTSNHPFFVSVSTE